MSQYQDDKNKLLIWILITLATILISLTGYTISKVIDIDKKIAISEYSTTINNVSLSSVKNELSKITDNQNKMNDMIIELKSDIKHIKKGVDISVNMLEMIEPQPKLSLYNETFNTSLFVGRVRKPD